MSAQFSVTRDALIERVGDELMVVVPGNNEYIKLSGNVADVLLGIQRGHPVSSSDPALGQLEELGVITTRGTSRRGLITAGAVGAGAGIAMLSMPAAAAASSPGTTSEEETNRGGVSGFCEPGTPIEGIWFAGTTSPKRLTIAAVFTGVAGSPPQPTDLSLRSPDGEPYTLNPQPSVTFSGETLVEWRFESDQLVDSWNEGSGWCANFGFQDVTYLITEFNPPPPL